MGLDRSCVITRFIETRLEAAWQGTVQTAMGNWECPGVVERKHVAGKDARQANPPEVLSSERPFLLVPDHRLTDA